MRFWVVSLLLSSAACFADPPRLPLPPIPVPQLPVRQYNVWQSIQAPLARSRGAALDDSIVTSSYFAPVGRLPIESAKDALDIQTQSLPRPRLSTLKTAAARAAELDRREYELFLHGGLSDQSLAAVADAEALNASRTQRDQALFAADVTYQQQLALPHVDRVAANRDYVEKSRIIQRQYQLRRANILDDRPTTQPSLN